MSNQTKLNEDQAEQSSTRDESGPRASEELKIRRPRPGSVVIIAPAGTPVSVVGTEECMKVALWPDVGE